MISCNEAVTRLWDYLERSLPLEQEQQINEHIAVCRQCCGEADFAGHLRDFLGTRTEERIPPDVRKRLELFLADLDAVT